MMTNQSNEKAILYYLSDKKYHIHRHVFLQLFALLYASDVFCAVPGRFSFSISALWAFIGMYLIFNLTVYPNAYIFVPRYLAKRKFAKYTISAIGLIIICLFIMATVLALFEEPDTGVLRIIPSRNVFQIMMIMLPSGLTIGLQIIAVAAFMSFRKWLKDNKRADELKAATLTTELMFLKSQINPHFLFNILNNANILAEDDPNMASQILVKLDDLLHYQMNDSTRDKVYLSADISFLRDFLDLEKTRRDDFKYTISKEGNTNNVQISPLLFIPFVENAVKHNFDSRDGSFVHISFTARDSRLVFTCENSIPKEETPRKVGGLGLANILRRLDLLYKDNYTLEQTKTDTVYSVRLELTL